ncbi:hypothetical protein MNEG_5731 [Monoraphidium neglectum]|uniref:Uncharacterized protein n=1 Tax=Monoraphidium neglectum TaxID=145388 RepID=A0A0D2MGM6_9CHLO|nr:hypothetical protein MNEG_5731 [Monoraphidium neglectum]KIZ02225.1 hypothetical protein MNEG_5731 [Monoraphidium neglectum]|eukprot:XP_013901244.1 hypothetical protein MNEG_5731 [Monoraphidium neglectum]
MVGRKVKRYWPDDAAKNKGDPWFMAVVTDYDPVLKIHVLTYSLGTQKEEREDVNLSTLHQGSISFTGDWIDLERWYADPKRREKSYAVKARWGRRVRGPLGGQGWQAGSGATRGRGVAVVGLQQGSGLMTPPQISKYLKARNVGIAL